MVFIGEDGVLPVVVTGEDWTAPMAGEVEAGGCEPNVKLELLLSFVWAVEAEGCEAPNENATPLLPLPGSALEDGAENCVKVLEELHCSNEVPLTNDEELPNRLVEGDLLKSEEVVFSPAFWSLPAPLAAVPLTFGLGAG